MNRRESLLSLAVSAVAALVSLPTKRLSHRSLSRKLVAVDTPNPPAPWMFRIDFVDVPFERCEDYLRKIYGEDRILSWGGQAVFPVVDNSGGVSFLKTAYVACADYQNRLDRWRATKPPKCPSLMPSIGFYPNFDGGPLGRGGNPYCCKAHSEYHARGPQWGEVPIVDTVGMGRIAIMYNT